MTRENLSEKVSTGTPEVYFGLDDSKVKEFLTDLSKSIFSVQKVERTVIDSTKDFQTKVLTITYIEEV